MKLILIFLALPVSFAISAPRYRVYLTDPRCVCHTDKTINTLWGKKTDVIGYRDLTAAESSELVELAKKDLGTNGEGMPFSGHSPIYVVTEVGEKTETPILSIGLAGTWVDKKDNRYPRGNEVYNLLHSKIPPPKEFDCAPKSIDDSEALKKSGLIHGRSPERPFHSIPANAG